MADRSRRWARYLGWVAVSLLTLLSAIRYASPTEQEQPLRSILEYIQGHYFSAVLILAIIILGLNFLQEVLERWATDRRKLKQVLDSAHKVCFRGVPEERLYLHRVTLFKASRRRSVPGAYLKIFARSGTAFQRSDTRLLIDDERLDGNEGVAARAWFTNAQATVVNLPAWPEHPNPDHLNDPLCNEYATKGLIPINKAARLTVKSRSIDATVVRKPSGERWGVLVLDSQEPDGISDSPEKKALVALTADLLTRML